MVWRSREPGLARSSVTREERQSGDGPHPPAVGSAHHMVKQSEGHWLAPVLSTFIAVDVCSLLWRLFFFFFSSVFSSDSFCKIYIDIYLYVSKRIYPSLAFFVSISLKKAFILRLQMIHPSLQNNIFTSPSISNRNQNWNKMQTSIKRLFTSILLL